ncbi:MAG: DUF5615 family PIN-like protein [Dehalococcoidia bacterium]
MKIKLDNSVPRRAVPLLTGRGHDVLSVTQEDLASRDDRCEKCYTG